MVMKREITKKEKLIKLYIIHLLNHPLTNAQPVPVQPSAPTDYLPPAGITSQPLLSLAQCARSLLDSTARDILILSVLLNIGHKYQHLSSIS